MITVSDGDVESSPVSMDGAKDVEMKVLIGPDAGSQKMTMRLFSIQPGGHTPYHTHGYEHLVRVESGKGVVTDAEGRKHELSVGQSVFVAPNEKHQFSNPFEHAFQFTCTIPNIDCTRT